MLLLFTLIISISWILYELLIGTLSSYLIWDSIRQFSFTIGFFMTGMGMWAYISRFLEKNAIRNFLKVELLLSVVWASSAIILKLSYIYLWFSGISFTFIYFFLTIFIWMFVWIEIPMIASIYKELNLKSKSVISDIFTFDYIWALLAALLFPIVLLPFLWLYNISIFIWTLNLIVWFLYLNYLRKFNIHLKTYYIYIFLILSYLVFLVFSASKLEDFYLKFYFKEPILESYQSDYQNIVLTKRWEDFRMYLNWNLQFLSLDENRYHEALIDWPLNLVDDSELKNKWLEVLVLWWWDWLAVRNLLKYDFISKITLVELDPKIIDISKTQVDMLNLNENSLNNNKLEVLTLDAFKYIIETDKKYDFIIADFPDPRDVGTAKLYSKEFYISVYWSLNDNWLFITQASSAFFATKAFWSIDKTIFWVFWNSLPYHRYLPSFWDWWFVLAMKKNSKFNSLIIDEKIPKSWKTLWNISVWNIICHNLWCTFFDKDYMDWYDGVKENTLTKPVIIEYYWEAYKKYNL